MNATFPQVKLRAIEPEDLDLLYQIENDSSVWGVGMTNVPYSRYLLHNYVSNATGDIYTDKQVRLIVDNADGDAVGIVDLMNFDPKNNRAEVGIIIELPYRRRGIAEIALRQLHQYAKTVLHIHQLYAYVDEANVPSVSLFRKLGYACCNKLSEWLFDGENYHDALLFQIIL